MTLYFSNPTFKFIIQKLKGNQVYLFNTNQINLLPLRMLQKIPFLKKRLHNITQQPEVYVGAYKGLYYKINKEAYECTRFVIEKLNLKKDCPFIKIYNNRFQTNKVEPFVYKWISTHVFYLLNCLYRVYLHEASDKIFYLDDTPLNRHVCKWWSRETGYNIRIIWLGKSETAAGLATIITVTAIFFYKLLSRGFCFPVKPRKFKILKEAVMGLKNPIFRDDFFIDNKRLLKTDILLYKVGSGIDEQRLSAYKDAQNSEYETVDISELKVPLNILCPRFLKYHLLLPLILVGTNFRKKQNYLLRKLLPAFHMPAINYEILLSHYRIGLEFSSKEVSLAHIPETIILNCHGSRSVIWHWSDMTGTGGDAVSEHFKSFNIYLIWGKAHYRKEHHCIDNAIETGCWLKHNFGDFTRNKRGIYEKLGLPVNGNKVLAFYDESFSPEIHFTEAILLDFWQMMAELIETRKDVIAVLKPKSWSGDGYENMSVKGRETFNKIRARCLKSGRFYLINNPREVGPTEVIAISDINITMGMGSPSAIALLCGKTGLYYDTTGNNYHPFAQKYRNKLVFTNKRGLFTTVNRIIDEGYNPLDEIDPGLLEDYDHFRDNMGLEKFREALLKNL